MVIIVANKRSGLQGQTFEEVRFSTSLYRIVLLNRTA